MARVLVVDDDPLLLEIASEILKQAGHEVITAENGARVAALPSDLAPALAIVDMLMPERDGVETIGDLKRRWPKAKIIAISAGARGLRPELLLRMATTLGADATLPKPLDPAVLAGLVASLLG